MRKAKNTDFEVEKIIDKVEDENGPKYLVKWKGISHKFNTWEPIENL